MYVCVCLEMEIQKEEVGSVFLVIFVCMYACMYVSGERVEKSDADMHIHT
jgi:hypothetical protein